MPLESGTRLGSYELLSSIGRGGMGEVYRARDSKLGRDVAVKVLRADFASDPERLRRFEQEARAASALNHPNIVYIYDIGEDAGTHFIAMELVEGKSLREILSDAPLEGERILELSRQLADGLAKAHAAGIVHRDVKPENVMVTADGFVKILDFGLAKLLSVPFAMDSDMATLARTRHGMLIGTVEYMSPEQAAGKSSVDHRSDQFSLGLILYEMATGKLAFQRETAAQTLASIIESEPPPMVSVNPRRPLGLEAVVSRCLSKDPQSRYADTRDLARALKALSSSPSADPLPPDPPVPQNPVADGPPFLGNAIARTVEGEIRSAFGEVERELRRAFANDEYRVESDGKIRKLSESRLRRYLRRNRYSGIEMVRREGDDVWVPLHETRVFAEEVPQRGSSMEVAAKRKAMDFVQHLAVYLTFGVAWFFVTGEVPFWMGFWAIGLVSHGVAALPALYSLARSKGLLSPRVVELEAKPAVALPDAPLSETFRAEVSRVRELLDRRGGENKDDLLSEIDRIVDRMRDVASKKRDLEDQTSLAERDRLEKIEREATERASATESARDRKLYQRQVEVVRGRRQTIQKALAVLEHLRVGQDVAEHQVKQLRLDLSRAEASSASVPKLSSRLQDIRHEVDAIDRVDEALAKELTS